MKVVVTVCFEQQYGHAVKTTAPIEFSVLSMPALQAFTQF